VFSKDFSFKSTLLAQNLSRPQECSAFLLCKPAKRLNLFAKAEISSLNKANLGENEANFGLKLGSFWVRLGSFLGVLLST